MTEHAHDRSKPAPLDMASMGQASIVPKSAEQVWAAVPDGESETGSSPSIAAVQPTQLRRPWRATLRTAFQAIVALATLAPFLAGGIYQADDYPVVVGQVLAVSAAVTRVMALPQVEDFLRRFLPFLAAAK